VVTAYSRMDAKKHDIFDVGFGALNGILGAYIWTEPYQVGETAVFFQPWNGDDFVGIQVAAWKDRERRNQMAHQRLEQRKPHGASGPDLTWLKGDSSLGNGNDPSRTDPLIDTAFYVLDQSRMPDPSERETTGYLWFLKGAWEMKDGHQLGFATMLLQNKAAPYNSTGLGDSFASYLWRFYNPSEPEWWMPTGMAVGADLSIPTGDDGKGLGSGNWVVRPKLTAAWSITDHVSFFPEISLYESFDETSTDNEVSMVGLTTAIQYQFTDAFYASWTPEFLFDSNDQDAANHIMEVGYPMANGWVPYFQYALIGNSNWMYNPPSNNRPRYYDDTYALGIRKLL